MRLKADLIKKDIVIVLVCLLFLVINVGAINSGGRRRAKRGLKIPSDNIILKFVQKGC
jgi:hypothetical protein